jgi:hypothetical protein
MPRAKVSTTVTAGSGFTLECSNMIESGRPIKLITEKECAVGVAFYPDFAYNAEGGVAPGEDRTRVVLTDCA